MIRSSKPQMIKIRSAAVALLGAGLLGACVSVPTAPTVPVMPSPYKPLEVFQGDDQFCRGFAHQQVGGGSDYSYDDWYTLQYRYNIAYAQCMYSRGNQVSSFTAPPNVPPPPPSAPPPSAPPPASAPPAAH